MGENDLESTAEAVADVTGDAPSAELVDDRREPLPRAASSDRLLWIGAGAALLAHLLPFVYLGQPDPLGEGVLTEAIAVELVDKAVLEGKDQTPPSRPAAASPPPQPSPPAQAPPGAPQRPQQAVPPSPPPAPAVAAQPAPKAEEPPKPAAKPPKTLPAFEGEDPAAPPKAKTERPETKPPEETLKQVDRTQPAKPEQTQAKPRPPQPQRPPPQRSVAPQAPAAQPSAKAAPPRDASTPALAKSGQVSKFAKEVVAALAKAKPSAAGIKGSVTVTVVVAFGGGVRTAKVTGSSGREDLDKLALDAAKTAKLPSPPADVTTDDLFYDVEYKFE